MAMDDLKIVNYMEYPNVLKDEDKFQKSLRCDFMKKLMSHDGLNTYSIIIALSDIQLHISNDKHRRQIIYEVLKLAENTKNGYLIQHLCSSRFITVLLRKEKEVSDVLGRREGLFKGQLKSIKKKILSLMQTIHKNKYTYILCIFSFVRNVDIAKNILSYLSFLK